MMMKRTLKNEEKQTYIRQGSAGIQRQTGEGLVGKQGLHVVLLLLLYRYYVCVVVLMLLQDSCARAHGCVPCVRTAACACVPCVSCVPMC